MTAICPSSDPPTAYRKNGLEKKPISHTDFSAERQLQEQNKVKKGTKRSWTIIRFKVYASFKGHSMVNIVYSEMHDTVYDDMHRSYLV